MAGCVRASRWDLAFALWPEPNTGWGLSDARVRKEEVFWSSAFIVRCCPGGLPTCSTLGAGVFDTLLGLTGDLFVAVCLWVCQLSRM